MKIAAMAQTERALVWVGFVALLGCQSIDRSGEALPGDGGAPGDGAPRRQPDADGSSLPIERDAERDTQPDTGARTDGAAPFQADAQPRAEGGTSPTPDAALDAAPQPHLDATLDATPERPDFEMACLDTVITARLAHDQVYARHQPVEIIYTAPPGYEVTATAFEGGRIEQSPGRFFYTPGGREPGDLPWPRWTGPVNVSVWGANLAAECVEIVDLMVTVAGDVVLGDRRGAQIVVYGSDGHYLGPFATLEGAGVQWITVLPSHGEHMGGLAAVVSSGNGNPPKIKIMDPWARRQPIEAAMDGIDDETL